MKTTALFIVALIFIGAQATSLDAKVNELMMANTMASDAVDTV